NHTFVPNSPVSDIKLTCDVLASGSQCATTMEGMGTADSTFTVWLDAIQGPQKRLEVIKQVLLISLQKGVPSRSMMRGCNPASKEEAMSGILKANSLKELEDTYHFPQSISLNS